MRSGQGDETGEGGETRRGPKLRLFGRDYGLPRSRALRIALGMVLVLCGIFGFLPILGFWMAPLGLLVLSYEFAIVRRWRRRLAVWWERRKTERRKRVRK